jgi:hypothetical protein
MRPRKLPLGETRPCGPAERSGADKSKEKPEPEQAQKAARNIARAAKA